MTRTEPPRPDTVARLASLVALVKAGGVVTANALRVEVARERSAPLGEELSAILGDPDRLIDLCRREEDLRRLVYRRADGRPARRRWSSHERRRAVVDLNNVVWTLRHRQGEAPLRIAPIVEVTTALKRLGVHTVIGVADANLFHIVADAHRRPTLEQEVDELVIAPPGTQADGLILEIAERRGAIIVGNDRFRRWLSTSAWRRRNVWRLTVPVVPVGSEAPSGAVDAVRRPTQGDVRPLGVSFGDPGDELADPPPSVDE